MTSRRPLYFHPGDDEDRVFLYLDANGDVVNLTGYTASWVAVVGAVTVTVTGSVDGPNGLVEVVVDHTDTLSLGEAGWNGSYELAVTSSGGDISTISEGPLILLPDRTT